MTHSEVITKLQREGFAASVGRIRHALRFGYLEPLPKKGARGAYQFTPRHLTQLRRYFVQVRPGPRPEWEEDWPVKGSADRLNRLALKRARDVKRPGSDRAARKRQQEATDSATRMLERISQELNSERESEIDLRISRPNASH